MVFCWGRLVGGERGRVGGWRGGGRLRGGGETEGEVRWEGGGEVRLRGDGEVVRRGGCGLIKDEYFELMGCGVR